MTDQTPDDQALAMENDLLRHEVAHVRARLADADAEVARLKNATPKAPAADPADPADPAVRDDLVGLLERLESTPVSRLLRRKEGYRRLVRTYLGGDA